MQWNDEGILLSARPYGENALLVHLLTAEHGRHGGLVPGGQGRRNRPLWQIGNRLQVHWQARLAEHLGTVSGDLVTAHAARHLADPDRLVALGAACALAELCFPERELQPGAFAALTTLLDSLHEEFWPSLYVHWECGLLGSLGFGLDLSQCAATGGTRDLVFVSPKTGRAVSREAGDAWRDKLLPLPGFLREGGAGSSAEVSAGLRLTGHFLEHHVLAAQGRSMPAARSRLVERLRA